MSMAVKGEMRVANPDNVEMTVTITMSVGEWKKIRKKIRPSDTNDQYEFCGVIDRLMSEAEKKFVFYETKI